MRARHMPVALLQQVGKLCQALMEKADEILTDDLDVPFFPDYRRLLQGTIQGACLGTLGVHRLESGDVERVIALYDEEDESAPVLVLTADQIGEFINLT